VRFTGDAVLGLEAVFLEDWLNATGKLVDLGDGLPESERLPPLASKADTPARSAGPLLQVIPSGPDLPTASVIAAQFVGAIASADQRCWIATPYFIPDAALSLVLRIAALRGVDVRILVPAPANNDSRLVGIAARSYYDTLLDAGCQILEYQPGMLHAKYMVIDDSLCAIGSANMDIRSLYINYEVTAMFYDEAVTTQLAEVFLDDASAASPVRLEDRKTISSTQRLVEGAARLASPLM